MRSPETNTGTEIRRLVILAGFSLLFVSADAVRAQSSQLPPRGLTGPNGEYIHDAWRGSRAEFPDAGASALAQDSLGFLLVAAPRGVYRFDGRQFLGPWAFPFNGAETILIDRQGSLWSATHNFPGIARRLADGSAEEIQLPGEVRGSGPVVEMTMSPAGLIYFAVGDGVFVFRDGQVTKVSSQKIGRPIVVSPDGTLWTATQGLRVLRGNSLLSRPDLWKPADDAAPTALMFDRRGQLWVGDKHGLVVISNPAKQGGGTVRRVAMSTLRVAGAITTLMEDDRGRVWIGTAGGGVSRYDEGHFSSFTSGEGLSDDFVDALFQDRNGNIWIGTRGGLDRLRPRAIRNITTRDGLGDVDVWSTAVEPSGSMLVGTRRGGLSRIRGGRVAPLRDATGAALEFWNGAVEAHKDGTLYLSANGPTGTWRLDPAGTLSRWKPGGREVGGGAFSFLTDPDGTMWVGGRLGLLRVRGNSVKEYRDRSGPLPQAVWGLARDSTGTLWVAAGALYRVAGDSLQRVCETGRKDPMSLLRADGAGVWYGNRLSLYRNGRCIPIEGPELPKQDIYEIEKDHHGQLWVAATEGLFRFDEADLVRRALDPKAPLKSRLFDRLDGLLSVEFNSYGDSPSAVTSDGVLLFASAGGLAVVDPAGIPHNPIAPRPLILSVTLNDSLYAMDRELHATLGAGKLEFAITAPSLGLPERLRLQYRLDGRDTTWIEAGARRRISYALTTGGAYTFRLRAANEDGVWSTGEARYALELDAPFTRTWPFYLLFGAILLGSGLGVGAIRSRVIAGRERQLKQLVTQRTSELVEARDRLEERVVERTAALAQESAERLKIERNLHEAQKMESVGRLAGGVAHDLNNMLTVVLGNADLLRDSLDEASHAEVVEQILASGNRAARLTSQLLSFARRQLGQPKLIVLEKLVQGVEPMLRSLVTGHVTLLLDFAPGLWNIWADRGQLEQVLVNLTLNAVHAMPNGGTLTIETSNVQLTDAEARELAGLESGEHVRVVVRDTGVGIEPQVLAHIFEPFFSTKGVGEGTGLGLASCYGIVKQWGGHIAVASEPAKGTAVTLLFPRSLRHEVPAVDALAPETLPAGSGSRILLVEDQPEVRLLARRLLESGGHQVTEACDGEEALAHLEIRGLTVDLVVSDVVMPRMNGKALADHLARTQPALPVLLMTGYSRGMLSQSGLLDPAYRVIEKPFERTTLLAEVSEMVSKSVKSTQDADSVERTA